MYSARRFERRVDFRVGGDVHPAKNTTNLPRNAFAPLGVHVEYRNFDVSCGEGASRSFS
ncbi:hypothetical protein BDIM_02490 [Brevundimonas diminuta ATCC 11568]|nr:hypothetical protein BDIM_02490 [Brevundimonas diminuta ATCC 11568]